jgi:hypothetical protein
VIKIMIRLTIVINVDERILRVAEFSMFVNHFAKLTNRSNTVSRQEKAMVNAKVIMIIKRVWCLNSD